MPLKSLVVIFQALKPLQPHWPQQPHWLQQPLQPYFIIELPVPDVWIILALALNWLILVPFCWMDHQKYTFLLIYMNPHIHIILSYAVEASWCHFFENCLMKFKCPNLLSPLVTIIQENYQSFYPSEAFTLDHSTMRHPVVSQAVYIKSIILGVVEI